jgi:hypothetical protein
MAGVRRRILEQPMHRIQRLAHNPSPWRGLSPAVGRRITRVEGWGDSELKR